jgi:predicted SAM-dependent methyltransferase
LGKMDLRNKHILHFSPERVLHRYLIKHAKVETADLFPGFYRDIDKNMRKADITQLHFPDNNFDIVIANHVLEHVSDDGEAMRELYRVLKNQGIAILQVPFSLVIDKTIEQPGINDPHQQSALFGQQDHVRIYQLQDYMKRLKQAGFTVEYIPEASLLEFSRYAIQPGEGFFSITKKASGSDWAFF